MTGESIIDEVLNYTEGVDSTDSDNDRNRLRILTYVNGKNEEIHHTRNWQWKIKQDATLQLLATTNALSLPADFEDIGEFGSLVRTDTGEPLEPVMESDILDERIRLADGAGVVDSYAIFDSQIQTVMTSVTIPLRLTYVRAPQVITDSADTILLPVTYHRTVLLAGVIAEAQDKKSDLRKVWQAKYDRGLSQMIIRERKRRNMLQTMPGMLGSAGW